MKKVLFIVLTATVFFSCKKESNTNNGEESPASLSEMISENGQNPDEADLTTDAVAHKSHQGYVYTNGNEGGTNYIHIYKQQADGSLSYQDKTASGGAGLDTLFGSQGALVLNENHEWLYAVNAGGNSVSSFKVNTNGSLTLAHTIWSGGDEPISVTVHQNLLYVVNSKSANIYGYTIGAGGSLTAIPGSSLSLSSLYADPGEIKFHPNGHILYVTEKFTNKISSFLVNAAGKAYSPAYNPATGITPFGFDFARDNNYMVVGNVRMDMPYLGTLTSYNTYNSGNINDVNGAVPNNQTSPCWIVTTKYGRFAFAANSFTNNITSSYISARGALYVIRPSAAPTDDRPRDIVLIDNYYLYVLNITDHTISEYHRGFLGSLQVIGHVTHIPVWAAGLAAY